MRTITTIVLVWFFMQGAITAQSRDGKVEVIVTVTNQDDQPVKFADVVFEDEHEGASCTTGQFGSCSLFVSKRSVIGNLTVFWRSRRPIGGTEWKKGMSLVAIVVRQ